jgi:hypothetical protein
MYVKPKNKRWIFGDKPAGRNFVPLRAESFYF